MPEDNSPDTATAAEWVRRYRAADTDGARAGVMLQIVREGIDARAFEGLMVLAARAEETER